MRTFDQWMSEYQVSHNHPTNKLIHKIAVPLIVFSVIGILWCVPIPQAFKDVSPYLNWSTVFVGGSLVFYLLLNVVMFLSMVVSSGVMFWVCHQLYQTGTLMQLSLTIFVLAWALQFYGHKLEGKKPSFLKDLVFLLIGPLWVLRALYASLGIRI
ncbi:MAG TPA: Mpo1-like protein [Bacteriovoracaceae bacterium]|nr:Mpo1-like protein [Bacteriovoracaceae bacterium]